MSTCSINGHGVHQSLRGWRESEIVSVCSEPLGCRAIVIPFSTAISWGHFPSLSLVFRDYLPHTQSLPASTFTQYYPGSKPTRSLPAHTMRAQQLLGMCLISFQASLAAYLPPDHILWGPKGPPGATLVPMVSPTPSVSTPALVEERDTVCTNSPSTRNCWFGGYSVAADFDNKWPTTDNTVHVSRAAYSDRIHWISKLRAC